jgi:hypothetical protein
VDVIVTQGTDSTFALRKATSTIAIVERAEGRDHVDRQAR